MSDELKYYEVVLEKTAVIMVKAKNEHDAYNKAVETLRGDHGYCEYGQDGYEIIPECISEAEEQSNED